MRTGRARYDSAEEMDKKWMRTKKEPKEGYSKVKGEEENKEKKKWR